jgi:energy-coupling factor transporter ATP-binding protein EcfA2
MEIRLQKLTLENFKGVRSFTFEPEGKNCLIMGENGSGKTSLMDAFLWLLFNKDSQGQSDFAIKTLDGDGREIPNIEHSVEGVLEIRSDGPGRENITLKKVYREKWTRKRGSAQADFTGHETNYSIDGVPVNKKDWDQRINGLINEETFKLLTSPTQFNALHWQKRREILLKVCGDISDQDVIDSNEELRALPGILGKKSLDDQKKIITAKRAEINSRLKEIPARIDELSKSLVYDPGWDIRAAQTRIEQLDMHIQAMRDNTVLAGLKKQKLELEAEVLKLEGERDRSQRAATKEVDDKVEGLEGKLLNVSGKVSVIQSEIARLENDIRINEKKMVDLRQDYTDIAERKADVKDKCPACDQYLPEDQVQEAIKKFNEQKAKKLAEINDAGKKLKADNEGMKGTITEKDKEKSELQKQIIEIVSSIEKAKNNYIIPDFDMTGIDKLKAEIEAVEKQISENTFYDPRTITPQEEERKKWQKVISDFETAQRTFTRIDELKAEEKNLAAEYENLESQIFLMEKFTITKVNLLEGRINSKFALARFKLFEVQINQGISECCETLFNGAPYSSASSGEQILVGLDIVSTLQVHYDIKSVVWLDHRESLTSEPKMDCQLISLIADGDYHELTVEVE